MFITKLCVIVLQAEMQDIFLHLPFFITDNALLRHDLVDVALGSELAIDVLMLEECVVFGAQDLLAAFVLVDALVTEVFY